jgi:hypothetical protein
MMEAVRTSETSVDNQFTRQYNPEDSSEHIRAIIKPSNRQTFLSAAILERKTFRLRLSMRLEN